MWLLEASECLFLGYLWYQVLCPTFRTCFKIFLNKWMKHLLKFMALNRCIIKINFKLLFIVPFYIVGISFKGWEERWREYSDREVGWVDLYINIKTFWFPHPSVCLSGSHLIYVMKGGGGPFPHYPGKQLWFHWFLHSLPTGTLIYFPKGKCLWQALNTIKYSSFIYWFILS